MSKIKNLLISAFLVITTAYLAGLFTRSGTQGWYIDATKPILTPPDSVFPIVWSLLYISIIISFYMVLEAIPQDFKAETYKLFISQLVLQILWCFLFFYMKYFGLALAVIVTLDLIVWQMLLIFQKIRPLAGYILYPYFIWICFATYLNFGFIVTSGMAIN